MFNWTCVEKCPEGHEINFDNLRCEPFEPNHVLTYLVLGYIGVSSSLVFTLVFASKLITIGKSSLSDSALAFLAPIDQLTKLFLVIGLAVTAQSVVFSIQCTLMVGVSILGVYFTSLFLNPIL